MLEAILKIANQKENHDGFTVSVPSLKHMTTGVVVAYKETQNSFGKEGLKKCIDHALKHDGFVGGWFNEQNGRFYFDSVKVYPTPEFIEFGLENKQEAVFFLDINQELRLK